MTGRRGSSVRSQHEAELDDIIGAMDYVDNEGLLGSVRFMVKNLDRLPKYGPEEINVCAVVDRQRVVDGQVGSLAVRIDELESAAGLSADGVSSHIYITKSIQDLDKKVSDAFLSLSARIESTNSALTVVATQINRVRHRTASPITSRS
jgi:hypothetical protein